MRKPDKNANHTTEEEELIQEVAKLEEKLASLKANIPAHSMSVHLMAEIEDTEEEIKQKKEMLKRMRK
jgi:DNA repair exonuclease SbcCD ATPase subunit